MKRLRTVLIYSLLLVIVAAAAAWMVSEFDFLGTRKVNISGIVTRDGKPLEFTSDDRHLHVAFLPEERDHSTPIYPADCDVATGRFEVKEVPVGRYIVSVQIIDGGDHRDILKMVYDPSSTDIVREVTHDGQEITIDLPKVLPPRRTASPGFPGGARPANRPAADRPAENKDEP